jgi:hypothetical protein
MIAQNSPARIGARNLTLGLQRHKSRPINQCARRRQQAMGVKITEERNCNYGAGHQPAPRPRRARPPRCGGHPRAPRHCARSNSSAASHNRRARARAEERLRSRGLGACVPGGTAADLCLERAAAAAVACGDGATTIGLALALVVVRTRRTYTVWRRFRRGG